MKKNILISLLATTTIFNSLLTSERRNSDVSLDSTNSLSSENHELCSISDLSLPEENDNQLNGIPQHNYSSTVQTLCSIDRVLWNLKTKTDVERIKEAIEFISENKITKLSHALSTHKILLSRPEIMMAAIKRKNAPALRVFLSYLDEDNLQEKTADQQSKEKTQLRILAPHIKSILKYIEKGKSHIREDKKLKLNKEIETKAKSRIMKDINRRKILELEKKIEEIGASREQIELARFIDESGLENKLRSIVLFNS